mmetsp:Transcript_14773/g.48304  ORF Transcript_14773/g.48304 Transcript_14773/m.48304 type:complete len:177 (+) Transcript_14773:140-670(+)
MGRLSFVAASSLAAAVTRTGRVLLQLALSATTSRCIRRWRRFTTHIGGFYEAERSRKGKLLRHCEMYVVRVLPAGRMVQGSKGEDTTRFGNSKPCVRCLQALDAAGIRRVIYTTGIFCQAGEVDCEVQHVADLLELSRIGGGHSSRGDTAAGCAAVWTGEARLQSNESRSVSPHTP